METTFRKQETEKIPLGRKMTAKGLYPGHRWKQLQLPDLPDESERNG